MALTRLPRARHLQFPFQEQLPFGADIARTLELHVAGYSFCRISAQMVQQLHHCILSRYCSTLQASWKFWQRRSSASGWKIRMFAPNFYAVRKNVVEGIPLKKSSWPDDAPAAVQPSALPNPELHASSASTGCHWTYNIDLRRLLVTRARCYVQAQWVTRNVIPWGWTLDFAVLTKETCGLWRTLDLPWSSFANESSHCLVQLSLTRWTLFFRPSSTCPYLSLDSTKYICNWNSNPCCALRWRQNSCLF